MAVAAGRRAGADISGKEAVAEIDHRARGAGKQFPFRHPRLCGLLHGLWRAADACRRLAGDPRICGGAVRNASGRPHLRSEEHTSELQSLMRISYAFFCLKEKTIR